jgi:hypothetical protein
MPKKEKRGKPMARAEKGAEHGLHKGWEAAKGTAHDVGKHVEKGLGEEPEDEEEEKED